MSASVAVNKFRRDELEQRIEELIALLDMLDGDPDLEANGDELDVGMPENWCASAYSASTVLEDDEDSGDIEENGDENDCTPERRWA